MIAEAHVTHWATSAPWATPTQVEQDLLLSRLICEIATDPYLGPELVFRGGTCLHKLRIHPARRYSEDLDYVRVSPGGIGPLTAALTQLPTRPRPGPTSRWGQIKPSPWGQFRLTGPNTIAFSFPAYRFKQAEDCRGALIPGRAWSRPARLLTDG